MTNVRGIIIYLALGLVVLLGLLSIKGSLLHSSFVEASGGDFREFYCAEEAVLNRANPYRVEPLRTCTHRVTRVKPAWLVVPAPLPGYAFAAFLPFAKLPFPMARMLWEAMLVASVIVAAFALAALTRWHPLLVFLVLLPTDGLLNLAYGELPPIVVAALCVGALAVTKGNMITASICGGIALIEPHLGLPAVLAMVIAIPRSRVWIALVTAILVAASIAAIGFAANVEYFRHVLPLQAAAEVVANDQYSLTRLLALLKLSPAIALAAGSVSFAIMLTAGIAVAVLLAKRGRPAYLFLLPPAAVLLGGTYIHDVQFVAAIPVALLLAAEFPQIRTWIFGAVVLLLLPATSHKLSTFPASAISALIAMVGLGWAVVRNRASNQRIIVFGVEALAIVVVGAWLWSGRHDLTVVQQATLASPRASADSGPIIASDDYASAVWGLYLRQNATEDKPNARYVVEKLPAWAGIVIILACACFVLTQIVQRRGTT